MSYTIPECQSNGKPIVIEIGMHAIDYSPGYQGYRRPTSWGKVTGFCQKTGLPMVTWTEPYSAKKGTTRIPPTRVIDRIVWGNPNYEPKLPIHK